MSDLMKTLRRVEEKVDTLNARTPAETPNTEMPATIRGGCSSFDRQTHLPARSERGSHIFALAEPERLSAQNCLTHAPYQSPERVAVPHLVLLWPRVYSGLMSSHISLVSDLRSILHEGVSWFAKKEVSKHRLSLPMGSEQCATGLHIRDHALASEIDDISSLHPAHVREVSSAYFDTFNLMYPVLDRRHFVTEILEASLREGYIDEGATGTLLLLVLALGRVAIDGNSGTPISVIDDQPSGFRGGSLEEPPGLAEFNEARRRFGFLAVDCTIEYVQIMLLQAVYYESHSRHIDYWRCVTSASFAVQGLQKLQHLDWDSFYGDQVKRAFWTCVVQEEFFHIDLDLTGTGISQAESTVPLPHFHGSQDHSEGPAPNGSWIFHAQFLALITLRGIITRIHEAMHSSEASFSRHEPVHKPSAIPITVVREFARQINHWQATLPRLLRWSVSDHQDVSQDISLPNHFEDSDVLDSFVSTQELREQTYGILKAQLRTRFYYARFMLYRPFIYKALHAPEGMTTLDIEFCALAIRSSCAWPLAIAAVKNQKRLFPHLFSWTRTSMETLLLLRMTLEDSCLREICHDHASPQEVSAATLILQHWLRDIEQLDGVAEWACVMMDSMPMGIEME